jgi:hypothetical protein
MFLFRMMAIVPSCHLASNEANQTEILFQKIFLYENLNIHKVRNYEIVITSS